MDSRDLERLFSDHAEGLFAFLAYRTGDRAEAEDLLGATFERALRARRRFRRRKGSEKSWLYAIALNLLRDQARRHDAGRRALERVGGDVGRGEPAERDPALAGVEARQTLQAALQALAPEEREAVALRFGAELTVPEIAELLDVPLTTAEGRVYRALRRLRSQLGEDR